MKVRNVSRLLCIILVTAMLLMTFAGCKKDETSEGTTTTKSTTTAAKTTTSGTAQTTEITYDNSWEKYKDQPITFTIFMDNEGADFPDYGKNWITKKMIADTGVTMVFEGGSDSEHSMLRLRIASNQLPDFILGDIYELTVDLVKNDMVYDLELLAKEHAPDFMSTFPDEMQVFSRIAFQKDGFFMMPRGYTTKQFLESDNPFIVNTDRGVAAIDKIYEEFGSPRLNSLNDTLNLLRQVKEKYPEMIPVQARRGPQANDWGDKQQVLACLPMAGLSQLIYEDNGVYKYYFEHPYFVDILKFLNTAYNEKLFSPTDFTDTYTELSANILNQTAFMILDEEFNNVGTYNANLTDPDSDMIWTMIEPPSVDPAKIQYSVSTSYPYEIWSGQMMTKQCKDPERGIVWFDYLNSDYFQKMFVYGEEGLHHKIDEDGYPRYLDTVLKVFEDGKTGFTDDEPFGFTYVGYFRQDYYTTLSRFQQFDENTLKGYDIVRKYFVDRSDIIRVPVSFNPEDAITNTFANVRDYYSDEVLRIIMGSSSDVVKAYDNMISKMKSLGLDEINSYVTDQFEAYGDEYDKWYDAMMARR